MEVSGGDRVALKVFGGAFGANLLHAPGAHHGGLHGPLSHTSPQGPSTPSAPHLFVEPLPFVPVAVVRVGGHTEKEDQTSSGAVQTVSVVESIIVFVGLDCSGQTSIFSFVVVSICSC